MESLLQLLVTYPVSSCLTRLLKQLLYYHKQKVGFQQTRRVKILLRRKLK